MPPNAASRRMKEAWEKDQKYDFLRAETKPGDLEPDRKAPAVPRLRVPDGLTDEEISEWVEKQRKQGVKVDFTPGNEFVKFSGDEDPQDVADDLFQFAQNREAERSLLSRRDGGGTRDRGGSLLTGAGPEATRSGYSRDGSQSRTRDDAEVEKLAQEYMRNRGYSREEALAEARWFLKERTR